MLKVYCCPQFVDVCEQNFTMINKVSFVYFNVIVQFLPIKRNLKYGPG